MAADLPPPSYDDVLRADALLADSSAGQVPETTAVTVPHGDDVVVAMGAPNEDAHWQATSRAPDTHPQATAASAETPVADETDGAVDEGPSRYAWITAQPKKNKVKVCVLCKRLPSALATVTMCSDIAILNVTV